MTIRYPITQMAGALWNILDATGCRIAWCGYDDDHESSGPPIAAELVALADENRRLRAAIEARESSTQRQWHIWQAYKGGWYCEVEKRKAVGPYKDAATALLEGFEAFVERKDGAT